MHNSTDATAFSYYTIAVITALLLCTVLISLLQWPLMAEIPLAICIFVQIMAVAKSLYKYWNRFEGKELLAYLFNKSKTQLLHFETSEEEVNI